VVTQSTIDYKRARTMHANYSDQVPVHLASRPIANGMKSFIKDSG